MRYVLSCAVLFLATIGVAQQQEQPPSTTTPPIRLRQRSRRDGKLAGSSCRRIHKLRPPKPCPLSGLKDRFSINSEQSRAFPAPILMQELTTTQLC